MRTYKIAVGCAGVPLEWHILQAKNKLDARHKAITLFLTPDVGYDFIDVIPVRKEVHQND